MEKNILKKNVYIERTESLCRTAEINIVNQLYFNLKKKKSAYVVCSRLPWPQSLLTTIMGAVLNTSHFCYRPDPFLSQVWVEAGKQMHWWAGQVPYERTLSNIRKFTAYAEGEKLLLVREENM